MIQAEVNNLPQSDNTKSEGGFVMTGIMKFFRKKAVPDSKKAGENRNMELLTLPGTRLYRKNNYILIHKKRLQIIGLLFIAAYGLLLCRLFYIQVQLDTNTPYPMLDIEYGPLFYACLLYTSDAADDLLCVDLGGRRIIKKKKN